MTRYLLDCAATLLAAASLFASEHKGQVKFGGLPLPGATITLTRGEQRLATISDGQGAYSFADVPDGVWKMEIEMLCFETMRQDLTVAPSAAASDWELKLRPIAEINAAAVAAPPPPPVRVAPAVAPVGSPQASNRKGKGKNVVLPPQSTPSGFQRANVNATANAPAAASGEAVPTAETAAELNQKAADGFLINGTSNNAASTPFGLSGAFGNFRRGARSLYNGNIGLVIDNSIIDARAYSITGQNTPKPDFNLMTATFSFGGPLKIPRLLPNGPNFTVNYQWTRNRTATTQSGLMPTAREREGSLAGPLATPIFDPASGLPFSGNLIPKTRISSQARALLNLYPSPNFEGGARYNYQIALVGGNHQDAMQSRLNKSFGRKDQVSGGFSFQSVRTSNPNLFSFLDTVRALGMNANVNWRHSITPRLSLNLGYQYSRQNQTLTPFFAGRENVAGNAGITGNNQEGRNWGPPTLSFANGISTLSDAQQSVTRNQTSSTSAAGFWIRGRHSVSFGGDLRKQQFNLLSQQDPRGTFVFTGASTQARVNGQANAATGSAFAGFLLGVPDTSSIAFGNADKYLRATSYDGYITDDWRVSPGLTLNAGVRWEYGSPITERYGRLVNLDITQGYAAQAPVVGSQPVGAISGTKYPDSLIYPDKAGFQPRVGLSWRPFAASSLIVRAGYGLYYNSSVYQMLAMQMAQQAPLSKSLSVQNSAANPLTLANGFSSSVGITPTTFAVDPRFQVGFAHNWQMSVQRDLPGALVVQATYLVIKGTRGVQALLPNTYPAGTIVNPCPACPSGFTYVTSNGNSNRQSGQLQLRRRLYRGFGGTLQYTYSKSIDNAALGGRGQSGSLIAQDWLNLSGERSLSNFDQRHLLSLQAQYTSGMGLRGGALMSGWRASLLKEWTVTSVITVGSGLPLTPVFLAAVNGTGVTGSIRPNYTGASVTEAPPGLNLNPAAYAAPTPGRWGNAGRNSITGPGQFLLNGSLSRTFRLRDRISLDARIEANNALNHPNYPSWNAIVTSAQFGLPMTANPMRNVQTTLRARF